MIIKSLELQNFRNYEDLKIDFSSGTNILYGLNAQGKTNILEAIYLSATTKSHKNSKDKEIIKFDKEESHIKTIISKDEVEEKIDMHLRKSKSKGIANCVVVPFATYTIIGVCSCTAIKPPNSQSLKWLQQRHHLISN